MKVMTVVGTRPEIIKLSRVIPELDRHFEHTLVHTGQNYDYELGGIFFEQLDLRWPNEWNKNSLRSPSTAYAAGELLFRVDASLRYYQPDAVLILGDTNSGLAAAYAAKRRHIPIFHMEAGNRCFDDRVPEEVNRRMIDHISDINMPYTEHARRNLLAEGIRADRIIKTGSPMREVLEHYSDAIVGSDVLKRFGLDWGKYFVVSAHREENVDDSARLLALVNTVNALSHLGPVIFSVHPRTRVRLGGFLFLDNVRLHEPFGFFDYCQLQRSARCVISDSGTLTEEAALMQFPSVMIRQAHERPEGMDEGIAVMSDLSPGRVLAAVEMADRGAADEIEPPYEDEIVARTVARTILSYTDYVQRTVYGQPSAVSVKPVPVNAYSNVKDCDPVKDASMVAAEVQPGRDMR